MSEHEPVVVTGTGAVTPYGVGVEALGAGLFAGTPTAGPITRFDAAAHEVRIACEVPGFDPAALLPRKLVSQLDPFCRYALVAVEEALRQAELIDTAPGPTALRNPLVGGVDAGRVATVIASSAGGIQEVLDQHSRLLERGPTRVRPFFTIAMPVNMATGQAAVRHGLRGPSFAVSSACASGTDAVGLAVDLIRAGRADVVVAGGAESTINPVTLAAFATAGALSTRNEEPDRASRPFDAGRDGFVMGEGAGVLVLERAGHAAARGATVLGTVAGYAASNDAHHVTAPQPDADGATVAVGAAVRDAGLVPGDIDHVNAHGTSTPANDRTEALALRRVLDGHTDEVPVTSTKSTTGHLLAAAGAVEAIATLLALSAQQVPPTANLDDPDPACALDVVAGKARDVRMEFALSTSFGFGGHNASLVLGRGPR